MARGPFLRSAMLLGAVLVLGPLAVLGARSVAAGTFAFLRAPSSARPPEERNWAELQHDATRLLGRRVRFVVQFQGAVERWNPYLTRFSTREFAAFQCWSDEQHPWLRSDFEMPLVRVFARRGGPAQVELERARPYERIEVEGTLCELFLAEPWIEVDSAHVLPEQLTEGTVIHASRALELMDAGVWKLAQSELDQALQATLPRVQREELERLRVACRTAGAEHTPPPPSGRTWRGPPLVRPRRGASRPD